jgi:hypothetical protein
MDRNYNGTIAKDDFIAVIVLCFDRSNPKESKGRQPSSKSATVEKPVSNLKGASKAKPLEEALMKMKEFLMNPKNVMKPELVSIFP